MQTVRLKKKKPLLSIAESGQKNTESEIILEKICWFLAEILLSGFFWPLSDLDRRGFFFFNRTVFISFKL